MNEQQRLEAANAFIKAISDCGRRFFYNKDSGDVAYLELGKRGHVFFIDDYTKKRVYTHYKYRWSGFTHGGTLRGLIKSLREFVKRGHLLNADYFQPEYPNGFRNPWGYGDDILKVRQAAIDLGLANESKDAEAA